MLSLSPSLTPPARCCLFRQEDGQGTYFDRITLEELQKVVSLDILVRYSLMDLALLLSSQTTLGVGGFGRVSEPLILVH